MNDSDASNQVQKALDKSRAAEAPQGPLGNNTLPLLQPDSKSILDEAKETAERIEKANMETKRLLEETQKLQAIELLGGKSRTTTPVKEKSNEEKIKEEANKLLEGTGLKI